MNNRGWSAEYMTYTRFTGYIHSHLERKPLLAEESWRLVRCSPRVIDWIMTVGLLCHLLLPVALVVRYCGRGNKIVCSSQAEK